MRTFFLILLAGLGCGVLGSGGGWLIGRLSPEFIALIAQPTPVTDPESLGAVLGLISGLLLGAGAMAFGLLVEAFRVWALRPRQAPDRAEEPTAPPDDPTPGATTRFRARPR